MTASLRTAQGSERYDAESSSAPDTTPAEPQYERVDLDRYVVHDDGPVGYVESVPPVFVCYVGHPYPLAHEVAQVHDFHRAVETVRATSREISVSPQPPMIQA